MRKTNLSLALMCISCCYGISQIDKRANKDPLKNVLPSKVESISTNSKIDSIKKSNTIEDVFNTNKSPKAKVENITYTVVVPNLNYEVISFSTDPEDGKNIFYHWKNVLGNPIKLKFDYHPEFPKVYFKVEFPGTYKIRHVVIDKGKKRDSIDFTIIGIKPNDSPLIAIKTTNSTQQQDNSIPNYSPMAKIKIVGGKQIISLDQLPLILSSNSIDPENTSLTYVWSLVRGDNCIVESPGSSSTRILNLKEGDYSFKLSVKDVKGLSNVETVDITVISSKSNLANNTKPSSTNVIVSNVPAIGTKDEKILPLKGGPEYALLDLVFPGVGHYYTSGDYTGFGKKKYHFITTAAVGTLIATGLYFKLDSDHNYNTYKSMVLEYQKNDLGVLTGGKRGGIESDALKYYDRAKLKDQLFKGLLIGAGTAIVGDAVLTLFKGLINKSEYNRRYKLGKYSLHIDPMSKQYYGVASIRLNR